MCHHSLGVSGHALLTPQKVPEVWAASGTFWGVKFSPSWVMWERNSTQSTGGSSYLLFCDDFYVFCYFCKFESCTTPKKCSPRWVTWELNFSASAGDNSYFLFYNDFDVSCTLSCNFCKTHDQFSPLWVIGELSFPESTKHQSDDFNVLSTFWKFEPCTTQDNFCPLRVKWELNFAESAGDNSYLLFHDDF